MERTELLRRIYINLSQSATSFLGVNGFLKHIAGVHVSCSSFRSKMLLNFRMRWLRREGVRMCLREPTTLRWGGAANSRRREAAKQRSGRKPTQLGVVHTLVIPYHHKLFQRAENYLKCESLIGVLKERGGRELEEDLRGNIVWK